MRAFIQRFDIRVSLVYGVVATLWIIFSDSLMAALFAANQPMLITVSMRKGIGFVVVTTLALFAILFVEQRRRQRVEQALQHDITERRRSENALRESEQQLRLFVEHAPAAIAMLDKNMKYLLVSQRWFSDYRLQEQNLIGRSHYEMFPEIPQRLKESHQHCLKGAIESSEADAFPRADGTLDWVRWEIRPWQTNDGQIGGLFIFSEVITERMQAEVALQRAYDLLEQRVDERTAELQSAKDRVEAILNNSLDGILLTHTDLRIRQANPAFYRLLACEPDTYDNLTLLDLIHTDDAAHATAVIQTAVEKRAGVHVEARISRKDGSLFEAELSIGYVNAHGIDADGLVCAIRDITERKRAQNALAEERNLLRTLIETMPGYIYAKDTQHRFVLSNAAHALALNQHDPHDLIGKTDFDFYPAARAELFQAQEEEVFRTGQPLLDHEQPSPEGTRSFAWVSSNKVPLHNLNGDLIGLVGISYDISERKERERQLRYHASVQESINEAVITADTEFRLQSWNRAAEAIFGWRAEEVLGKTSQAVFQTRFGPNLDREQAVQELFRQGVWQGEIIQRRKDGSDLNILASLNLLKDETGSPIGVVAVNRDITARKKTEHALNAKIEEEHELQRYLKELQAITIELTPIDELGEFYRRVVELGLERFGLDRLALFLRGEEPGIAKGTYGTDAHGKLVDEHHLQFAMSPTGLMMRAMEQTERFGFEENCVLYDANQPVGAGWNVAAVLRNGPETLGWLVADNLIHQKPASKALLDIVALYGLAIGTLLVRKNAEAALRESEARYRLLAENITDLIISANPATELLYVSPSSRRVLGYEPEELVGQPGSALIHPMDLVKIQEAYAKMPEWRGQPVLLTYRARHKDGHYLWLESNSRIIFSEETKEIQGLISSVRDITERKQAEDALRESEARFRYLIEAAPDYVFLLDPAGTILMVNPAALRDSGYNQSDLIGHNLGEFFPSDSRNLFVKELPLALESGFHRSEERFVRRDGSIVVMDSAASVIYEEDGQPQSVIVVKRDVTKRKQAEDTLRQALAREKELNELKSRFVSMASHEFRNPLATILATTDTLSAYRQKLTDAQIAQRLGQIQEQVGHLKAIMDDVLQLARMQARRAEFNPISLNLDALIRNILEEFRSSLDVTHQFQYTCDNTLSEAKLDKRLMRQIIGNLLSNAIKYSAPGATIAISLSQGNDGLILKVRDEGIGIPESDLEHLFEPFHRATNAEAIPGTGLGLTIAREAVELHSGTIRVESQLGVGTTFTVNIPVAGI